MLDVSQAMVPPLPLAPPSQVTTRWFCPWGYVAERDGDCKVVIGGTLVGRFHRDDRDRGPRNWLMVTLADEPSMHFGHLAAAFGVSDEYLRVLRRKAAVGGLGAVWLRKARATPSKVSEAQQRELRRWFAQGLSPTAAFRRQRRRRDHLSRATISRERARWRAEQATSTARAIITAASASASAATTTVTAPAATTTTSAPVPQLTLFGERTPTATGGAAPEAMPPSPSDARDEDLAAVDAPAAATANVTASDAPTVGAAVAVVEDAAGRAGASAADARADRVEPADDPAADDEQAPSGPLRAQPVRSRRLVQHVGAWLMMAMAQQHGLHDAAAACGQRGDSTRIALDATIAALAIGERCVEGVRRLQTPTVTTLLGCDHAPTASGVRRRLHRLADEGGAALVAAMSTRYIAAARGTADAPAVFYVDCRRPPDFVEK